MAISDSIVPKRRPYRLILVASVLLALIGSLTAAGFYEFGKRRLGPSGGWYFLQRTELPVALYLQGDPVWGEDQLGQSVHTMGQVGCAVTSAAMIMKFYGLDTDPGRLNVFLRDHDGYDEENDLRWEGPHRTSRPTACAMSYEDLPSYYLIDSNSGARGNPVIVRLHLATGWTHFVVDHG